MGDARRVAIIGATGYTGGELLRILLTHPDVSVAAVTSRQLDGRPLGEAHPHLAGLSDLKMTADSAELPEVDLVFSCLPHGESMDRLARIARERPSVRFVDLGADFRLPAALYEKWYGHPHRHLDLLGETVFGAPDFSPGAFAAARLVANPGCFAHCMILSLAPILQAGLGLRSVRVSGVTGSSGSGAVAKPATHHPFRNDSFSAYNVLAHRHTPEVEQALARIARDARCPADELPAPCAIRFVPQSGPFTRGIFTTTFVELDRDRDRDGADVSAVFERFAASRPFVRVRNETPRLLDVRGSNFFDLSVYQQGREVVIIGALDNLVKGAAGNAIQCMNLMLGFPETAGLSTPPLFP